jgi:hypothetical protein
MWLDELYEESFILWTKMAARLADWLDRHVWDGIVRGFGSLGQFFARVTTSSDERAINAGIDETTVGARGLGRVMSDAHSGRIQTYLGAIGLGTIALFILYAWLG